MRIVVAFFFALLIIFPFQAQEKFTHDAEIDAYFFTLHFTKDGGVHYQDRRVKSAKQIAQLALPAAVSITSNGENGTVSYGSGFYVIPHLIVTNEHVIKNATTISAQGVFTQDKILYPCSVITSDAGKDLAILKVDHENKNYILINANYHLQIGEKIYTVGSPRGLSGTFSEGIISGIRRLDSSSINYLQHTAPISPGSSGGPILNAIGEVVGVTVAFLQSGQNLNFAIPINYLASLASQAEKVLKSNPGPARATPLPQPSEKQLKEKQIDPKSLVGQDWKYVAESDSVFVYYSTKNFTQSGSYKEFWIKYLFTEPPYQTSIISKIKVDCFRDKYATKSFTQYDKKGEVINSFDVDSTGYDNWKNVVPETVMEAILEVVCGRTDR